jgi:hypothetical protein
MKVKIRYGMAGKYGNHRAGSIVDLPKPVAEHLLKTNQADPVEKPKKAVMETAHLEAEESAVVVKERPAGKKRGKKS